MKSLSRVRLFATPWTVTYEVSPSMGFSKQEYWSGLPFPSPGDLSDPGIEPPSPEAPALQVDFFFFLTAESLGKPRNKQRSANNQPLANAQMQHFHLRILG